MVSPGGPATVEWRTPQRPSVGAWSRGSGWLPVVLAVLVGPSGLLGTVGCSHLEPSFPSREAVALPADLARALRPPDGAWGLELAVREREESHDLLSFRWRCFDDLEGDFRVVEGEYYRTRQTEGGRAAPLVVLSPILAGPIDDYRASRYLAERACERGVSAMFLHQETIVLDPRRDAFDLERRLRQSVRDNIRALDLFAARAEIDAGRLGSIGVSLGGIKNVVLIAAEPRLRANVLCLAGTDLPGILLASHEPLVEAYLEGRRREDGLEAPAVAAELRRFLGCRPSRCAPSIESDRVFLVLGRFDDKVPFRAGLALRDALGGRAAWILPTGHYTTLALAPWVADGIIDWLQVRWEAGG